MDESLRGSTEQANQPPPRPQKSESAEQHEDVHAWRFTYRDSKNRMLEAVHPIALDFRRNGRPIDAAGLQQLRSEDEVLVQVPGSDSPAWESFDEYLDMFTAGYHDYFRLLRQREQDHTLPREADALQRQRALLYELHRSAVDRRTDDVRRLKPKNERVEARRINYQEETRAHSETFQKLFDDLNIPGLSSASVQTRNDYDDTIDDFILLDPEALATEEDSDDDGDMDRYLHIGVQRTFGHQGSDPEALAKDQAKKKKLEDKPLYWIPEHLEWGRVMRVYLLERFEDYGIEGRGGKPNFTERLYALRAEQARKRGVAANTLDLPPLHRVLGDATIDGKDAQHLWAKRVLIQIRDMVLRQMEQGRPPEEQGVFERYVAAINLAIHRINLQREHLHARMEARI